MKKWETDLKKNFVGDNSRDYNLSALGLPDNDRLSIRNGKVAISAETIRTIFEPVIQNILELINDQIGRVRGRNRSVKAVLLVGGFGSNEYLKSRIERQVGRSVKVIKVENWSETCPEDPSSMLITTLATPPLSEGR